ncbi:MAG: hypothetical protein ABI742_13590 [Gemmatimonadota bacterium]
MYRVRQEDLPFQGIGLALLGVCLLTGRGIGGPSSPLAMARAALVFLPLWFVGAGINMWIGVSKVGYSVADEAPVFLLVFAVPAAVALLIWWGAARA